MKTSRKLETPTDTVEEIFCNKCGLSCKTPQGFYNGLIEVEVTGGYESTHLGDGDVHKFSLCERCLSVMFNKFQYSSFQGNYLSPDPENQASDFDPKAYRGPGIIFPDDAEFIELTEALENAGTIESIDLEILPSDVLELDDEDDLDTILDRLPIPKRIKKEDMN